MYLKAGIKRFSQKIIISQYLNEEEVEKAGGGREQIPSVGLSSPFTCHFSYYLKLEIFLHYIEGTSDAGLVSHFLVFPQGAQLLNTDYTLAIFLLGESVTQLCLIL